MVRLISLILCFGLTSQAAFARDFTRSSGKLSDAHFYLSVACKSKNGRSCSENLLRWPASFRRSLTVGLVSAKGDHITPEYRAELDRAVRNAVNQVNLAKAGVKLKLVSGGAARRANIQIFASKVGKSRRVIGLSYLALNGAKVSRAATRISAIRGRIFSAGIVLSQSVDQPAISSVMLEEVVQALGLPYDILNPYYTERSIFAQSGPNRLADLKGQDAMALRRHYAK